MVHYKIVSGHDWEIELFSGNYNECFKFFLEESGHLKLALFEFQDRKGRKIHEN